MANNNTLVHTEEGNPSLTEEDDEIDNLEKKTTPGILYISFLPPKMTPLHLHQIFAKYGEVGRIFLQPETHKHSKKAKKRDRPKYNRGTFTEGWIEFADKKLAKKIQATFDSTLIVDGKNKKFAEYTWNLKYLHRYRWRHLTERLSYEKEVHNHKMNIERTQARKETEIYTANIEAHRRWSSVKEKQSKKGIWVNKSAPRKFKQRKTVEELRLEKRKRLNMLSRDNPPLSSNSSEKLSNMSNTSDKRKSVLNKIFSS